ncbi:uncharacterized protein F4812DRAFT_448012 [Daldinia caldariorum]|uniref:uncharacterized protein n=1 Tax=Daldinia caldariorum TaxID=326644 RepID=UPI002008E7E9|nr:uncharacterized protein F4812DRAFT_448012 [Daldinia caldariorum]KAI1463092.1 hypothetical protein F4812DRAFT_448012 [Daldinia caldariorum]
MLPRMLLVVPQAEKRIVPIALLPHFVQTETYPCFFVSLQRNRTNHGRTGQGASVVALQDYVRGPELLELNDL